MASIQITIRETVFVAAPAERVWDYTQDYACRSDWDAAVWEGKLTAINPERTAIVRGPGLRCTFRYKLFNRPRRSSVVMEDVKSWLVVGGGGAWHYETAEKPSPAGDSVASGTNWTQINSLQLRGGPLTRVFRPFLAWMLAASTRRAMRKAARRIELGQFEPTRPRTCQFAGSAGV